MGWTRRHTAQAAASSQQLSSQQHSHTHSPPPTCPPAGGPALAHALDPASHQLPTSFVTASTHPRPAGWTAARSRTGRSGPAVGPGCRAPASWTAPGRGGQGAEVGREGRRARVGGIGRGRRVGACAAPPMQFSSAAQRSAAQRSAAAWHSAAQHTHDSHTPTCTKFSKQNWEAKLVSAQPLYTFISAMWSPAGGGGGGWQYGWLVGWQYSWVCGSIVGRVVAWVAGWLGQEGDRDGGGPVTAMLPGYAARHRRRPPSHAAPPALHTWWRCGCPPAGAPSHPALPPHTRQTHRRRRPTSQAAARARAAAALTPPHPLPAPTHRRCRGGRSCGRCRRVPPCPSGGRRRIPLWIP